MIEFGPAFENYVWEVLNDTGAPIIREQELSGTLLGEGQVTDFAVDSENALLLVESKGIEGHYDELYHNLPVRLAEMLKTSILDAVDQAIDTAQRLPKELVRRETYFLCVTLKQVAIGDGVELRELTSGTPDWDHPRWDSPRLPPANMLVLCAAELERMVAVAIQRQVTLANVVAEIVLANAAPETKKALVEMYVSPLGQQIPVPPCVVQAGARLRV